VIPPPLPAAAAAAAAFGSSFWLKLLAQAERAEPSRAAEAGFGLHEHQAWERWPLQLRTTTLHAQPVGRKWLVRATLFIIARRNPNAASAHV